MTVPALPAAPQDAASPGLLGFLVMFALSGVTILLVRSMVKHLRKVRYGPDGDAPGAPGVPSSPVQVTPQVPQEAREPRESPPRD